VQGDGRDVQGDEEGLMMQAGGPGMPYVDRGQAQGQDVYYTPGAAGAASTAPFSAPADFSDTQWAGARPHPSPSFSAVSVPSPPPGTVPLIRSNRSSLTGPPAGYMRQHSHSSSSSASSSVYNEDYATSMSAPSHKQAFDHASLYPPGMLESAGGAGPIRRHRSMTPSLIRNGEQVRRPVTAASGEFAAVAGSTPGSGSGVGRGYHPYAYGSSSQSRNGSAQSSPSVYPIPLAGEYVTQQMHRSDSRSSSLGGQMMNMNLDQGQSGEASGAAADMFGNAVATGGTYGGGDMYRSESPMPFATTESPVPYTTELPVQFAGEGYHGHGQHAATAPAQFDKHGFYVGDGMEQGPYAGQGMDDGYYSHPQHPQHVTL